MGIIVDKSLGLRVQPESIAPMRNDLAQEAMDGLRQDIPGIEFGAAPSPQGAAPEQPTSAAATGEPQWQSLSFEPDPAPAPAPEPEKVEEVAPQRGFFANLLRKTADRAGQVLWDMTGNVADTAGDYAPDWLNAGLVFDENGVRWASGAEYDNKSFVSGVAQVLRDPDYKIVDHADSVAFDDVKNSFKEGDYGTMAKDAGVFAVENGIASVPDMIAMVVNAPSYFGGLISSYTQERAQNDGRDKPNAQDLAYGAGTALIVGALEKYGADRVLKMLGGPKSRAKAWLEGVAAETFTEALQNPVEFAGTRVGTEKEGEVTPGALGEQSLQGALGGLGGGAIIGGAAHGLGALGDRPAQAPVDSPNASAPAGQPAPAPSPGPVPAPAQQAQAAPAAPTDLGAPKPTATPAAPQVQPSNIKVVKLEPPAAESPVTTPAAPQNLVETPADAQAIANDQPSAEPFADIKAQIADMMDPESTRKGVYLSVENVRHIAKLRALTELKEKYPHVVNFDYRGGLMLFPSEESAKAADAARKGKKAAALQQMIGQLTNAGNGKPADLASAAVVQQLTPEGAVTKESLVAPAQVEATATAFAEPGRTVQVVAPEVAQARRAEGVAADNAQPPAVVAPPAAAPAAQTPVGPGQTRVAKSQRGGGGLRAAMTFLAEQEQVPAGKKLAAPLEQRQQNAAMFAEALKDAVSKAKNLPDDVIEQANKAVHGVSALSQKSEYDTRKGKGTDHARVTSKVKDLLAAAERVAEHTEPKQKEEPAKGVETPLREPAVSAAKDDLSDAQKAAGNYPKIHKRAHGLQISIENPKGSVRRSKQSDPNPWQVKMPADYGYIRGTTGADGDHVDVTLGPQYKNESAPVFIFNQGKADGSFDEHKVFLGFPTEAQARATYRASFAGDFGTKMMGQLHGVQQMSVDEFKDWIAKGNHKKPATAPTANADVAATNVASPSPAKSEPASTPVAKRETGKGRKTIVVTPAMKPKAYVAEEAEPAWASKGFDVRQEMHDKAGKKQEKDDVDVMMLDGREPHWVRRSEALAAIARLDKMGVPVNPFQIAGRTGFSQATLLNELIPEYQSLKKIEGPTREPITVKPRAVEGAELKAMLKDLGWDTDEIIREAEKAGGSKRAGRGALGRELARYLPEINKDGSWLQYIAALKTNDQITDGERARLFKAVQSFATAENTDGAREALVDQMQNLKAGPLDPKAIDAVLEYAQFRRAFEQLRERMDDGLNEELVNDEGIDVEEPPPGYDDGREYTIPEGAKRRINAALGRLSQAAAPFYDKIKSTYRDKNPRLSSKELLRELQKNLPKEDAFFNSLIDRLLKYAPDVPVAFKTELSGGAAGVYNRAGYIEIKTPDTLNSFWVRVVLHEVVHAATVHELAQNPNGDLARKLESLRRQALLLAHRKYGMERVEATLAYFQNPTPDQLPNGYMRELYGLTNTKELMAEVFTNPTFQNVLVGLGEMHQRDVAGPRTSFLQKVIGAVKSWLGIHNPRAAWLLQDVMDTTAATMRQQAISAVKRSDRVMEAAKQYADMFNMELKDALVRVLGNEPSTLDVYFQPTNTTALQDVLLSLPEAEPVRREANIRALTSQKLVNIARATRQFGKSQAMEKIRKGYLSMYTFDQIERRLSRFFGTPGATNPLTRLMDVRRRRQSHANALLERAEADVNSKWLKLDAKQSRDLGQMMIDATLWQIDPSKAANQQAPAVMKRADFQKQYDKLQAQWRKLAPAQKDIFQAAQRFNEFLFQKVRKAAIDLALDGLDQELTPYQRQQVYAIKDTKDVDKVVGKGKAVDVGDLNERLAKGLKDLIRITRVQGPYFSLKRYGDKVVQATREVEEQFTDKAAAEARAEAIREQSPINKAKVRETEKGWAVDAKINYVSFHKSRGEAEADAQRLREQGYSVDAITEKTTSVTSPALTPALKELLGAAQRKMGGDGEGKAAINFALENAFAEILAERSAAVASQLKREGFAGVKPEEMHMGFAERSHSVAWHYANMMTSKDEVRALTELRHYARDASLGNADQQTMYERGLVANEVERRIGIEAQETGHAGPVDSFLGKIGFANYLMTPSYTFVNSMQNFTVAMPVVGAKYGYGRTSKAFARAMRAVAGPAFGQAFRGMAKKPGTVTSHDIYKMIERAIGADPKYAKWVQGDNSAIKQLVDLGVINASFTQELMSVAEGESRPVRKAMEYARLLPQGAEMMNRISTALATLELTHGDVNKVADLVRLTQIDYSLQNQPRAFRRIGRVSLPRSLTMFKMYPQAIYNLLIGSTYDAITGAGASRAEAAKTLAGLLVTHTVGAGVIGGLLLEPLRLMIWAWNQLFGDDDEQFDLDSSVRKFMADTFGKDMGQVMSHGIFNAVGLDLSSRLGINHLAFYSPPDLSKADEASWYKTIAEAMGPIPSMIARNHTAFMKAWDAGRYRDALAAMVPIKFVQDANAAVNMATRGITTSSGAPVIPPEEINAAQSIAKFLGFRSSLESDVSDKRSTKYNYEQWLSQRKRQLFNFYWSAEAGSEERRQAEGAIREFNAKNPGAKITKGALIRSRKAAKKQAAEQAGTKVRNKDLKEKMDY